MPLDPTMKAILDAMPQLFTAETLRLPAHELRRMAKERPVVGSPAEVARVENRRIPGPGGDIPVRIYWPAEPAERAEGSRALQGGGGLLVFFHGGGWVLCDLDSHDATCRALTRGAGCITISVDYRLAPEHRFPAAPEDCYAATRWAAANARELGGDPERVAIGGDSAGGNLAAVVALMARERGGPKLVHQLLVYPATDFAFQTASIKDNGRGYMLTAEAMVWFREQYLAEPRDARSPLASPLLAPDLSELPPATIITAEFDPLRDEGEAYGARLREAGVSTDVRRYDGVIHGFFGMAELLPQARQALEHACANLRRALA
jgi:acetyl esterase